MEKIGNMFGTLYASSRHRQQKCETLSNEVPLDPEQICAAYWTRVGENLIALAKELSSHHQVR